MILELALAVTMQVSFTLPPYKMATCDSATIVPEDDLSMVEVHASTVPSYSRLPRNDTLLVRNSVVGIKPGSRVNYQLTLGSFPDGKFRVWIIWAECVKLSGARTKCKHNAIARFYEAQP